MKVLFVHQHFPGQFRHLAPALVKRGHDVVALKIGEASPELWQGVRVVCYKTTRATAPAIHPWVGDFETKAIRAEACMHAALGLKQSGFSPDVIVAHPGWGESLFLKDVWPHARLGIYCEFFYSSSGADVGFDPEFPVHEVTEASRIRMKNINNLMHFEMADAAISPTEWQASTFPDNFRPKISVIHDGIDTELVRPNADTSITIAGQHELRQGSEVITFINRNLEPYRGFHIFMRALPALLRERPKARILMVGGNSVSYGVPPANGGNWKDLLVSEVRGSISDADWSRVHFLGNIAYDQFIALMQVSAVHVYLTYPFVLSWSLLEAMSAGCAIVASNTQPLREVIVHGETGRLVDFFDGEGLVREISDLLENPRERHRLGQSARELAVQRFDLKLTCLPAQIRWFDALAQS